jgi:uncharacterized protein YdhG (YjbR/CyaY superfamily)
VKSVRPPAKDSQGIAAQVRAYLAAQPAAVRKELLKLQTAIRSAAPGAVEWFSYGVPGFRLDGKPLAWYGGWKAHTSLYPITAGMRKANAAELDDYETSKGTVRFPLGKPLPVAFVKRLVKARVSEIRGAKR